MERGKKSNNSGLIGFLIIALLIALAYIFYRDFWPKNPASARVVPSNLARSRVDSFKARRDSFINNPRIGAAFYYSAEVFTKKDLEAVLSEKQCDGLRIFHAVDSLGRNILLVSGVAFRDSAYQDLLPISLSPAQRVGGAIYDENYDIIDGNIRCPNMCDIQGLSNPNQ